MAYPDIKKLILSVVESKTFAKDESIEDSINSANPTKNTVAAKMINVNHVNDPFPSWKTLINIVSPFYIKIKLITSCLILWYVSLSFISSPLSYSMDYY